MSMIISIRCKCGAIHRQIRYEKGHPKNNDPRLDICDICGNNILRSDEDEEE